MKLIICLLTLLAATSAPAAYTDNKMGNVIAVEREISDITNMCISKVTSSGANLSKPQYFFSCSVPFVEAPDFSPTEKTIILNEDRCIVEATFQKGRVGIMFGIKDKESLFADAKNCLIDVMKTRDSLKILVYKIQ